MAAEETPEIDLQHDAPEASVPAVDAEDQALEPQTADSTLEPDSPETTEDSTTEQVSEPDASEAGLDSISSTDDMDNILSQWEEDENRASSEKEETEETETEEVEEAEPPLADQEEVEDKKPVKRRFQAQNDLENEFVTVKQRNPDMSIEDALVMAKANLGIEEAPVAQATEQTEDDETQEKDTGPQSSAEAETLANEAAEAHRQAMVDLDFEKAADLAIEIRNLDRKVIQLQNQESQTAQDTERIFNEQFDADQEKAIGLYPEAATPNSKFAEKMREIDQRLQETGNDLYFSSDKVSKIAMMAGNDLGIAPADPGEAPKKAKTVSSATKKRPVPPPTASGGRKTTTTSDASRQDADQAAIAALNSTDAIEDYLDKAMGGTY